MARTVDNLGVDVSSQYAKTQSELDPKLLKEAKEIHRQSEIDVTIPSKSEFDLLFDVPRKNTPWAQFSPPDGYNEQRKRLFTHQVIPSLGAPDKIESHERKVMAKFKEKERPQNKEKLLDWETEREEEEKEKEKNTLTAFFKALEELNKCMNLVIGKRMQFQKG